MYCVSTRALIAIDFDWLTQVPNVSWNDVGGLEDVKRELQETVQVSQKETVQPRYKQHYCKCRCICRWSCIEQFLTAVRRVFLCVAVAT